MLYDSYRGNYKIKQTTMKTTTTSRHLPRKRLVIGAIVVALLLLGVAAYIAFASGSYEPQPSPSNDSSSSSNKPADGNGNAVDTPTPQVESPIKANPGSDSNSTPTNVTITITASSQNDSVFQTRALINIVTNTGTCTATFTRDGYTTVEKSVDVQAGPSSTTCKGFDVPLDELASGEWNMKITFVNDAYAANTSKTIEIN